jgi:hypothetical protein
MLVFIVTKEYLSMLSREGRHMPGTALAPSLYRYLKESKSKPLGQQPARVLPSRSKSHGPTGTRRAPNEHSPHCFTCQTFAQSYSWLVLMAS